MDSRPDIEDLFTRYAGLIFNKCLRMLADRQEAEDAVQETFVQAHRALDSFTYGESALPWLYTIATNVCLKFLRTRRRKGVVLMPSYDRSATGGRSLTGEVATRQQLGSLVEKLDDRDQKILVSHFVDGMNQSQVAEALNISRRTVVTRLQHIRQLGETLKNDLPLKEEE
ncbi:MAG: sigma-70 family RNA polymerase sigma factor [Deltaproteobacteria bacterium]|nr:sigma-70 family RNA polymerase sigma factor [Deltaproteobacteria bacterium]